jgi:hypothetical protein
MGDLAIGQETFGKENLPGLTANLENHIILWNFPFETFANV